MERTRASTAESRCRALPKATRRRSACGGPPEREPRVWATTADRAHGAARQSPTNPSMRRRFVVCRPTIRPSHAIAEIADALIELLANLVAGLRREERRQHGTREGAHGERRQR